MCFPWRSTTRFSTLHIHFHFQYTLLWYSRPDREVGPWRMVFFHALTSWSSFHGLISLKKSINKVSGLLTRCKPNMDLKEWPCTKKWMCWNFWYMPQEGSFEKKRKNQVGPFSCLSCLHLLFPQKNSLEIYYNNISLPWALAFFY